MSDLPDPSRLTVGDVAEALRVIEATRFSGVGVEVAYDLRWRACLAKSPEYAALCTWCETNLGLEMSPETLKIVISRLAKNLHKPFNVVRSLPLATALKELDAALGGGSEEDRETNQGKGKPRKPAGPLTVDALTPTAWTLLECLVELRATKSSKAVTRSLIAKNAKVGNADSSNVRNAFKSLRKLGLIEAQRSVGTWATPAGVDAVKRRK
jgi:hypothetical protein